ncbi:uncharacterized protein EV420DRAFT_1769361 [Desarmillaria tabescens]|uniref:Heterokaryon incompatibility domain-containing protein n=1 Tax=Armillaria tabescens TaxID=1929756 RepID=A0AA39JCA4_ARMTA|nr:uncharacterized protein EV420DRAFT_1769361 [Desarmillaria tabescens]KAK0439958.1 hypothetical protein EV420DRAFT_1769361 [Desarmillaria tabescens]
MPICIVDGGMHEVALPTWALNWLQLRELTCFNYEKLPKVTLSALTETGKAGSTIPVPMQRSYTGTMPVIPSALADIPCADLGMSGVLKELNATLGTSYTLDNPILPSILESFIRQDYDFGTLYANLRPYWYDLTSVESIHKSWNQDQKMRQKIVTNNRLPNGNIPPRHIWDLYANRVVPYWVANKIWPRAISHAWVSDEERISVWTPINGFEWPVPIPKDVDLNLVRIEMLNLGAEYVWLDVLCLRQEGGKREDLRREEWKVDVPTIGAIYRNGTDTVVYYLSGLGRPFCFKSGDLESDRCWFRRAWTLQEVSSYYIIGGMTGTYGMDEYMRKIVDERLQSLKYVRGWNVLDILLEMQNRVSTKPLDKVAGLVYLLFQKSIPIYDETQSEEEAWDLLVDVMAMRHHRDLLFFYPEPGNGHRHWQPSWKQVMTMPHLPQTRSALFSAVTWPKETDANWCECTCIVWGIVRGLGEVSNTGIPRKGKLMIKDLFGTSHTFKVITDHAYPIPDGSYTLIGAGYFSVDILEHWVVGHWQQRWDHWHGTFEKVSVIRIADPEQDWNPAQHYIATLYHRMFLC